MALSSQTQTGTVFKSVFSTGDEAAAAPTASTDGQPVRDMAGMSVYLEADSTRTLSGAGSLTAYVYDGQSGAPGAWVRCADLDLAVPGAASGLRRWTWGALEILAPRNARVMWVPVGVTVSAGGTSIYQCGFTRLSRY